MGYQVEVHGRHLLNSKINRRFLIGKQCGSRGEHVQIRIDSQFVAILGDRDGFFRRFDRNVLMLYLHRKNSQRRILPDETGRASEPPTP